MELNLVLPHLDLNLNMELNLVLPHSDLEMNFLLNLILPHSDLKMNSELNLVLPHLDLNLNMELNLVLPHSDLKMNSELNLILPHSDLKMNMELNLTLLPFAYWVILHVFFFCHLIFLKSTFFETFFQEYHQCQTIWIQIRPDKMSGLIRVQTVCKGYQQATLVGRVKMDVTIQCDTFGTPLPFIGKFS